MVKPIDTMQGMGPRRNIVPNDNGTYTLTVTPPKWSGCRPSTIELSADQFRRYVAWTKKSGPLIENALPDLTSAQREIIITGIGPEDWKKLEDEHD
jgi:hypothetical protein